MALVLSGDGTVTGLAVGGLPDGTVDAGTLATDSVTAAKLEASAITGADLPAGSVLQVVNAIHDSIFNTTSTTYADTGIQATITPSNTSSDILVLVTVPLRKHNTSNGDSSGHIKLLRGSTTLEEFGRYMAWNNTANNYAQESVSFCYKDTAANTTSATTYKVQLKTNVSSSGVNSCHDSAQASITLMEIAG
jgi:hypothetical protein